MQVNSRDYRPGFLRVAASSNTRPRAGVFTNGFGQPDTSAYVPAGSLVAARDVRYEYDAAGQLRRIIDNDVNQITEYAYDAMGRHSRQTLTTGHFDDLRHSHRLRRTKAHEKFQVWLL